MEPAQVSWEPCTKNPPAPGYHWDVEYLGDDYRSGVIYWVKKDDWYTHNLNPEIHELIDPMVQ